MHGMRHARGRYVLFADADGASRFEDLEMLVRACVDVEDGEGRGVAVGSRAHLVGGDAVVKVCGFSYNYLIFIFQFHLYLYFHFHLRFSISNPFLFFFAFFFKKKTCCYVFIR